MERNSRFGQPKFDAEVFSHMPLPEGLVLQIPGVVLRELDDNEPTPARQAELRVVYQENMTAERPPYTGVTIETRGELFWVMKERGWSGDFDAEGNERVNLCRVDLSGTDIRDVSLVEGNLQRANLAGANLSGATLSGTHLQHTVLYYANLQGSDLGGIHANGAVLYGANLNGAFASAADFSNVDLGQADMRETLLQYGTFRKASLFGANLSGANLQWAELRETDLTNARMDAATMLAESKIDAKTLFGDISWNGVPLTQVDWESIPRLGDEARAREPLWIQPDQGTETRKPRNERIREYQRAARTYRSLALALKEQGLTRLAVSFSDRAERMDCYSRFHAARQHSLQLQFGPLRKLLSSYLQWLKSCVLYEFIWLSVHLGWLFCLYLGINLCFLFLYWWVGLQAHTGITLSDALVLSVTSFHGRGLSPATGLNDSMRLVAAIEAVCGLLIEALFIAAFTRRVLNS